MFKLSMRAEPGVDVIRSLRGWLKQGLREFGLRCVSIEEVTQENKTMVDMRKYTSGFIMPDDVRDGSRQERIINVYISEKHHCPVLEFESGDQLIAWPSVGRPLVRAYGCESDDWLGHTVELSHGTYIDKKTNEEKGTVVLKAISPRDGSNNGGPQRVDPAKLPAPVKRGIEEYDPDDMPY
jgi:hypothetical protein